MTQKEKEYKAAVEAILFAHGDAIGADKIAEALEIPKDQTVAILEQLQKEYEKADRGLCILPLGDKWQMATKTAVQEPVKRVLDKKPTKVLIALALVLCLVIGVCFATSPREEIIYGLSGGTYVMDEADAVQILPSRVTFRMSGSRQEFVFMLSPLSSYYMAGEYTINDSVVTCSDGLYTLVFKIKDNDTIVLQIPNQDGLHMSGLFIPNGTEFHYEEPSRAHLPYRARKRQRHACGF